MLAMRFSVMHSVLLRIAVTGTKVSSTDNRKDKTMNIKKLTAIMATFAMTIMTGNQVNAAVVNVTQGSTSGYTMTDGNTYVIQNSVSFSNSTAGGSGMTVAENATVVLYVPAGITLTATGANGRERTGGGAGIRVPKTATLVITGEGTVNATGGNAENGGRGWNGGDGYVNVPTYYTVQTSEPPHTATPGSGGRGGIGGGGGGAAIGGIGGIGGGIGQNAENGETMGTIYIIGNVECVCNSCSNGTGGGCGASGARASGSATSENTSGSTHYYYAYYYFAGGGGGGGGGGAGAVPTLLIGGGGSAGGAGGNGGSGTTGRKVMVNHGAVQGSDCKTGATGSGGRSNFVGGEGQGGNGAAGGLCGAEGGEGQLYVSSTAIVNVDRTKLSAETHSLAQYAITFNANGGTLSSSTNVLTATLGCSLPDCISTPVRKGCRFCGWKDGNGQVYYGNNGIKSISSYFIPDDVTLYAEWALENPFLTIIPADGTIIGASQTVSILSPSDEAVVYYTTDGSEPTAGASVYKRFRVSGKTTIKAIAVFEGWTNSEVAVAHYALGQCADPVITPNDGATFEWAGKQVSIDWQGEDGVLRYTTNGSDPTRESSVYDGPFTINDSTIVKAKAFGDQFFDSAIVTANITRIWTNVAMPQIETVNSFTGSKAKVVISCVTDGATIRYTLDGSEPNSHSTKYTGPFYVTDSCTVKASAMKYDYHTSAVATREIVKVWGIGDTMGKPDHRFTTDGTGGVGWIRVEDVTAPNGEAMKSGAITHDQQSVLKTKVKGPGTLTFSWRTSCEDSGGQYDWDHVEFAVDGTVRLKCDGDTSWTQKTVRITGGGEHTITWTYVKDDVESDGDDAAYVAGYGWVSDYTETKTTAVPVPYAWLLQNDPEIVDEFDAYEAAALATAMNGHNKVWECYVAGISPTNETARFSAKIEMVGGIPQITWSPNLNTNGVERTYTIWGKTNLTDGVDWECPTNSAHHFFKVTVEMP